MDMDPLTLTLFIIGFVLLISGAEFLVRGASKLAIVAGISPLVVGLTVVAYGTSSPEVAVTVQAALAGQADIAIGNVVGSNIANILLIIGLAATAAPLFVSRRLIRFDVPFMVALSFVVLFISLDGTLSRIEGIFLLIGAVVYSVITIRQSRQKTEEETPEEKLVNELKKAEEQSGPVGILIQLGFIVLGLAMLVLGSRWLINGAVVVARLLGVSELVISLTIIAVGTSLPEVATSIIASLRGERDIAVGNAVGSNIFNILLVLGSCSTVSAAGISVSPDALRFDIPVMIVVAISCLPVFYTGFVIARWEGILYLGYYIIYTAYLYLSATQSRLLESFTLVVSYIALPITGVVLLVLSVQAIRFNYRKAKAAKESAPGDT